MQGTRSRTAVRGDRHAVQRLQLNPGKRDDVEYFFDGDGQRVLYFGFFKAGEIKAASAPAAVDVLHLWARSSVRE